MFCSAVFILVVAATIYENVLAAQGIDVSETRGVDKSKHSAATTKGGLREIERCEMSNMNNNNNDTDCSKDQRKNDQRLGECHLLT